MPLDDPMLHNLSDQLYAATAVSDFTHAEALLRDYEVAKSFKEKADTALADRDAQYQQRLANLHREETERRNLLQAEHDKAIAKLNEETKRETEKRVVLEQNLEQSQQQLATLQAQNNRARAPKPDAQSKGQQPLSRGDVYEQLKLFTEVLSYMEANHVDEINPKDVMYSAIHGLMKRGDPEGSFISPEVYKEMQNETVGRFAGAGLELTIRDENLVVVTPLEDSPAFRVGIQPGDHIIKIDGVSTKEMSLVDAVKRLRGPEGSSVTLSIFRQGFTEPKDFTLSRTVTLIKSVRWTKLQDDIGYVKLRSFHQTTEEELEEALQDLGEQHIKTLILDLRNNPGGLLEQAITVSNVFLDGGKLIVYTKGRLPNQNMKAFSKSEGFHVSYPMVVIVNGGSAGASEIVAGALQDLGRARILGTPTFGRGSIQTIIPLSDGSALRLTTAQFFTPQGHSIHGRGISPDITVELPKPKNVTGDNEASGITVPPTRSYFGDLTTDMQLQRAVEMLQAKQ
jgi:carboxyl-terminal processing protease